MNKVIVENITKSFRKKLIISGGNITLETGNIVGIFGRNGTGKSTILSILFGTTSSEQLFFKLNDTVFLNRNRFKKAFSFSPQFMILPTNVKVKKVVTLFLEDRIQDFFDEELLQETKEKKICELSSGVQKYLQTKLILYNSPPFCLLDEPYSGLSPILIEKMKELIKTASLDKGIIITDHKYESVLDVSNQNYILQNGVLIKLKSKEELVDYGYLSFI